MRAVVYKGFGETPEVSAVEKPTATEGAAVLRVEACGICRSDWHGWMGNDPDIRLPHVPGHEIAGTVVETGAGVTSWREGDRVTVPFVGGCGECPQCATGNQQVCDRQFQPGFTHWGGFAEFVEIRYAEQNLVRLPEGLGFVSAASLGCRFITAYRAVAHQGRLSKGEWLAVHGCGGVGLAAILIGSALGAKVVAVDIEPAKLELARSIGADAAILSDPEGEVPLNVRETTGGGANVSLDAIGHPAAARDSVLGLAKRGRHVQVGLMEAHQKAVPIPMNFIVANEIEIRGSHGMQAAVYPEMFGLISDRGIDLDLLIGRTVDLAGSIPVLTAMGEEVMDGITVIDRF